MLKMPLTTTFESMRPAGGFHVILIDPPWKFELRSEKGEGKSAQKHYECQDLDWIKALPLEVLAAKDCALFGWFTWPFMPDWNSVLQAWGFEYAGLAWEWIKFNEETNCYAFGGGYGTRKNIEPCLLATRGSPSLRKDQHFFGQTTPAKSHSVRDFMLYYPAEAIRAVRREHSRKPDEQYDRIEQMFDGPYIELFSRSNRKNWTAWGNQTSTFEA